MGVIVKNKRLYHKYIIKDGDTLKKIALNFGYPAEDGVNIIYNDSANSEINKEKKPDNIPANKLLYIPLRKVNRRELNKIQLSVLKWITVDGPNEIIYGRVENPKKPQIFKKYKFKIKAYSANVTDEDKQNIKWAVKVQERNFRSNAKYSPKKIFKLDDSGEEIELVVKYDYIQCNIKVIAYIDSHPMIEDYAKKVYVPFSVRAIPQIMKKIGGLDNAARCQNLWFNSIAREFSSKSMSDEVRDPKPQKNFVTMDWVLSYDRAKVVYEKTVKNRIWTESKTKDILLGSFRKRNLLNNDTTQNFFISNVRRVKVGGTWSAITDPIDDLKATLANFVYQIDIEGSIKKASEKKHIVLLRKIYIFVRDSFDFVDSGFGSQDLGMWSANPPDIRNDKFESGYFGVENEDYNAWRKTNGLGYDFLLYSDKREIILNPPHMYIIEGE